MADLAKAEADDPAAAGGAAAVNITAATQQLAGRGELRYVLVSWAFAC